MNNTLGTKPASRLLRLAAIAVATVAALATSSAMAACDKPATSLRFGLVQPPDLEHPFYAAAVKFNSPEMPPSA